MLGRSVTGAGENVDLGITAGALKLKAETRGEGVPPATPAAPPKEKEKVDGELGDAQDAPKGEVEACGELTDTAAAPKLKAGSGTVSLGDAAVEGHTAPPRLRSCSDPDRPPTWPFFLSAAFLILELGVTAGALKLKTGAGGDGATPAAAIVNEFASKAPGAPLVEESKAGGELGDTSILRSAVSEMLRPLRSTDPPCTRLNPPPEKVPGSLSPAPSLIL